MATSFFSVSVTCGVATTGSQAVQIRRCGGCNSFAVLRAISSSNRFISNRSLISKKERLLLFPLSQPRLSYITASSRLGQLPRFAVSAGLGMTLMQNRTCEHVACAPNRETTTTTTIVVAPEAHADHSATTTGKTFDPGVVQLDHYNGVTLRLDEQWSHKGGTISGDFLTMLDASLQEWKAVGKKGIWIHVDPSQSDKVHAIISLGFNFHMVVDKKLVLTKWLDESTASRLPVGPTHQVGVGCLVFHPNDPSRMLVVQERTGPAAAYNLWKMPTGLADPGEDIHVAAMRELEEETGLTGRFVGILEFRQSHVTKNGTTRANSDLFFISLMQLVDYNDEEGGFRACEKEIADIQWMTVEEYCEQERWQGSPASLEMNRAIMKASQHAVFEHYTLPAGFTNGTNTIYKSATG